MAVFRHPETDVRNAVRGPSFLPEYCGFSVQQEAAS
jgi:hypothetical protein